MDLGPLDRDADGKTEDPTDLRSPILGCALVTGILVEPTISVLGTDFQPAFLNAASVDRLKSFSWIPSDFREASVSPAKETGVLWVLYLHNESAFLLDGTENDGAGTDIFDAICMAFE